MGAIPLPNVLCSNTDERSSPTSAGWFLSPPTLGVARDLVDPYHRDLLTADRYQPFRVLATVSQA